MAVVLLVRHGQASFGADDYDVLAPLGRDQAALVGQELTRRGLRRPVVVSGTLRRQRDTAALALPGAPVRVDGRFDEYDSLELLTRYGSDAPQVRSSRELQPLLDAALSAWIADDAGTWRAFADGALAAVETLVAGLETGQDAVVVTSGGILSALCSALLGAGTGAVVALNRVTVNAAISTLVVGSGGVSLVSFNEHAHLPREQVTYR